MITKVCDLGLGKLVAMNGTITCQSKTRAISNPGTLLYMSPECLLNQRKANRNSDMWSTGATIVELFTGMPHWQFSNEDFEDVDSMDEYLMNKVKRRERPSVISHFRFQESIPANMQSVLKQCLDYDESRSSALDIIALFPMIE